jgi:hypothetical protein
MAYTIRKTNGTTLGTIEDGTINTSATSLTLIGRNYSNYGQIMTDNLVKLVENFAYGTAPANPLAGQLWWNTTDARLRVYTGTQFKIISGATVSSTPPVTENAGDIWLDSINKQMYIYDGTAPFNIAGWILVGPGYSSQKGKSGAIWEQIIDSSDIAREVVTIYLNGVRTGIVWYDAGLTQFTPKVAIDGFTTIRRGYNQASWGQFWGTANNASYLGEVAAANYMRLDANNLATGNLRIQNSTGITVGSNLNLSITTPSANLVAITNRVANGNTTFYANVGGVSTATLTINGSTGDVTVVNVPSTSAGVATKGYVDDKFTNSPALGGVPTVPTPSAGNSSTQIANTEWVTNNSGFLKNRIYQGNSFMEIIDGGTGSANLVVDNSSVMTASASGVNLRNGATATTQSQTYNAVGDNKVATTNYVKTATTWWGGSAKIVSTVPPVAGVNDVGTNNGDFWFQREE